MALPICSSCWDWFPLHGWLAGNPCSSDDSVTLTRMRSDSIPSLSRWAAFGIQMLRSPVARAVASAAYMARRTVDPPHSAPEDLPLGPATMVLATRLV